MSWHRTLCVTVRTLNAPNPTSSGAFRRLLDDMKQHMRGSLKTEGIGRVVRNAHAKGYGLARGEVEILSGLPEAYAQGIYAKPGRHEAMVRFSNGTSHVGSDRFLGPIVGMGLKIFGIEGKTLLEDEPDSHTFDYALIDHPVFFVNTLAHYVFIQGLFADVGTAPPANQSPEEKQAELHRFLYNFVTGKGTLPPEEWAWEELGVFLQLTQHKYVNLLLSTYWTMGAVRHGDYIAKVRVAPVQSVCRPRCAAGSRSEFRPRGLPAGACSRAARATLRVRRPDSALHGSWFKCPSRRRRCFGPRASRRM